MGRKHRDTVQLGLLVGIGATGNSSTSLPNDLALREVQITDAGLDPLLQKWINLD